MHTGTQFVYASMRRRLVAGLIDWVVAFGMGGVGVLLVQVVWAAVDRGTFDSNLFSGVTIWSIPTFLLTAGVAHAALGAQVSSKGSTVGHGLMGLRILKPDGTRISGLCSLVRQIIGSPLLVVHLLPVSVLMVAWVVIVQRATEADPLLWIWEPVKSVTQLWWIWGLVVSLVLTAANHALINRDREGQGWHDKLVGTIVVKYE